MDSEPDEANVARLRVGTGEVKVSAKGMIDPSRRRAGRPSGVIGRLAFLVAVIGFLVAAIVPSPVAAQSIVPVGGQPPAGTNGSQITVPGNGAEVANWTPPTTVYIPETGHSVDGYFLDLWRAWGGANAFGYPITPEFTLPNGHVIQYYGYARFEYWPEGDSGGNYVVLGDIGTELRPLSIRRTMPGYSAGTLIDNSAAMTAAGVARAWLPLGERFSEADNTDAWRLIPETRHSVAESLLWYWDAIGGADYIGNPVTEPYTLKDITYQVFERGQIAQEPGGEPYLMPVGRLLAERYGLDMTPVGQGSLPVYDEALFIPPPPKPNVVTVDPNAEKWVEVDLTNQYMVAWQGNVRVVETYVSTGRDQFATPPGTFYVLSKIPSQTMEGVIGGEYYNVPNVPNVLYFTNVGHAFHGTYWHNNFGTPMSHGCVNLPMDIAEWMYGWAGIGMRIEIHF